LDKRLNRLLANLLFAAGLVAILYFGIFRGKDPAEALLTLWNIVLVAVGLGFVIFIHELGHFTAAKLCNVKVEAFSIGFGPPIPGCHFRKGETEYKVALFPLGGYVKMTGENPDADPDDPANIDPRSFKNKTVGQRMLIISAGVIMNVLLGMVCFIYAYFAGRSVPAARLGIVEAGSPAAAAGLEAGSRLLEIEGNTRFLAYEDLLVATALATPNETRIHLKWETPGGEVREADVVPRKLEDDPKPMIGVGEPRGLVLYAFKKEERAGFPGTPAAAADLRADDRVTGARAAGEGAFRPLRHGDDLAQAEFDFRGKRMELRVERGRGEARQEVVVPVEPAYVHTLGLRMEMGPVVSLRRAEFQPPAGRQFQLGDVIVALDGEKDFDPLHLAEEVMARCGQGKTVKLTVRRNEGGESKEVTIAVTPEDVRGAGTWNDEQPLRPGSPASIPALGVAFNVLPQVRSVDSGSPAAAAGLQPGDRVTKVTLPPEKDEKELVQELKDSAQWPFFFWELQLLSKKTVQLTVVRGGAEQTVTLTAQPDTSWPLYRRGFLLKPEMTVIQADHLGDAVWLGFRDTGRWIARTYMNLKSFFTGALNVRKYLGGPITILGATYAAAEQGWSYLIFILGMISINLAVVNFLPIPVLDGGHMVFLIVEKVRGKPVSEKALVIATYAGLAVIVCLMLFVIGLDVSRMEWVRKLFG
jgi:regulator of sigma E protease